MSSAFSRRGFLAAGAAAPAVLAQGQKAPQVAFRTLGKTGQKVTTVGFGCMVTSDPTVLVRAVDAGVTYFDTARVYMGGNNERMVGAALKPYRKKLVLSTKTQGKTKEACMADLETSLRELQTDYVDIWYLHAKNTAAEITPDILEAVTLAKKQGKVRFPGLSTHNGHAEVIGATIKTGVIEVVLTTYNFAMANTIEPIVKSLDDAGIGVVAMKVMAGSFRMDRSYDFDRAKAAMQKPGAALAALKWSLRMPYVHTAIPSIKDNDQLDENLRAMAEPFQAGDTKVLAQQLEHIKPLYCRMCGSCRGTCAQGLPVSDVIRYVSYSEGYGEFAIGRENYQTLPEPLQQVRCGDCTACTVSCPNGVKVRDRVSRAQELYA